MLTQRRNGAQRRIVILKRTSLAGVILLLAGRLVFGAEPREVAVRPDATSPTGGIQEAIDSLGLEGGLVTIPPGTYVLRQAVRVSSQITVQGRAVETILRKNKQVGSKLAASVGDQDRSVKVESVA